MKRNNTLIVTLLLAAFLFSGCTALVIGGAAVGASTGTFFYVNGELKTDYYSSFDKVWNACEKTVADMRGIQVVPAKEIAQGKITTLINDEKVQFDVSYKSKNLTMVAIRVGLIGNKLSSQLLHDKIAEHLAKN
ncbi:MAG: hypothetical protein CVU54_07625 [Deltaproteobacteria bacterium HGW-Deltaproteobacteria-12]|jgi:hypothetical protein|nr:MAG: hypothetical protein CVU54_07625 [Deltaproteobacteria bacterium HGW-Deltaproteobacteria-12]